MWDFMLYKKYSALLLTFAKKIKGGKNNDEMTLLVSFFFFFKMCKFKGPLANRCPEKFFKYAYFRSDFDLTHISLKLLKM